MVRVFNGDVPNTSWMKDPPDLLATVAWVWFNHHHNDIYRAVAHNHGQTPPVVAMAVAHNHGQTPEVVAVANQMIVCRGV